jgi:hypothetical protein
MAYPRIYQQPNLYSGGAVVFNTQPHEQFQLNLLAHQAAKSEALNNFYQNLNRDINSAGMRSTDIAGLTSKTNDLRNFYQQNQNQIISPLTDGGQKQNEYNGRYQDIMNYINQSKDAAAISAKALNLGLNLTKGGMLPSNFITDFDNHNKPLTDPSRKEFDFSPYVDIDKPFDLQKFVKNFSQIKRSDGTPVINPLTGTLQQAVSKTQSFNKDALNSIYAIAGTLYDSDPSTVKLINSLTSNPDDFNRFNATFKNWYGRDINTGSPHDLSAAYALSVLQPSVTKQDVKPDVVGKLNYTDALIRGRMALRNAFTQSNIDYRHREAVNDMIASDDLLDNTVRSLGSDLPSNLVKRAFGSNTKDENGNPLPQPTITTTNNGQTYNYDILDKDGNAMPQYHQSKPISLIKNEVKKEFNNKIKSGVTQQPIQQQPSNKWDKYKK